MFKLKLRPLVVFVRSPLCRSGLRPVQQGNVLLVSVTIEGIHLAHALPSKQTPITALVTPSVSCRPALGQRIGEAELR